MTNEEIARLAGIEFEEELLYMLNTNSDIKYRVNSFYLSNLKNCEVTIILKEDE